MKKRNSVQFMDAPIIMDPCHTISEKTPLLWTSDSEDETTSELSSHAVIERRNSRWGAPAWKSILEARPMSVKRQNFTRRTMIGVAPHLLDDAVDEDSERLNTIRKFFTYYDLFCCFTWIILQAITLFSVLLNLNFTSQIAVEWVFGGTMLLYCIIATGWIETTWDVLIAIYLFTVRHFFWAIGATFPSAGTELLYFIGDISFVFGSLLFIYAYWDDGQKLDDLALGSIAFSMGSTLCLAHTLCIAARDEPSWLIFADWFSIVANAVILCGRLAFARSSWQAQLDQMAKHNLPRKKSYLEECRDSMNSLSRVRELWRQGTFGDISESLDSGSEDEVLVLKVRFTEET